MSEAPLNLLSDELQLNGVRAQSRRSDEKN